MRKIPFRLLQLICLLTPVLQLAGSDCIEPTARQRQDVTAYVQKKYRLGSGSDLALIKAEKANDACFWKFDFKTPEKTFLTIYLSPDRTFIMPQLYDLRQDPSGDDQKQAAMIAKDLMKGDPPTIGAQNAPVTIVEFSDFECPYCERLTNLMQREVLPKEPGKVRVAFINFPLNMHPWAKQAALMATCAALQDNSAFWKVHDFLFANQKTLTPDNLMPTVMEFVSKSTFLNKAEFQVCLDKELSLGIVTQQLALGERNKVAGTPTLFINGVRFQGVQSASQLIRLIDDAAGEQNRASNNQ